jgi:hypothetical protein
MPVEVRSSEGLAVIAWQDVHALDTWLTTEDHVKPLEPFFNHYRRCVCGGRSARDSLIVYLDDGRHVSLSGKRTVIIILLPNN